VQQAAAPEAVARTTGVAASQVTGPPPNRFPCTGYPAKGTVTPRRLPLPTAAIGGRAKYVTGSVSGPTSWFGGPVGGAPGPFALTQQWDPNGWKRKPGIPYGMEIGTRPCNDSTQAGKYRSYYAAMRFSPREDGPKETAYQVYKPFAKAPRYAKWNGAPLIGQMAQPLSFLYGRKLAVSRVVNGKKLTVIVRATDRGPTEGGVWSARPVDLSPWAMGALTGKPKCLDWDGTNAQLSIACDFTGNKATNRVTVSWADNSLPLGPLRR
jgi:hypothetical protein